MMIGKTTVQRKKKKIKQVYSYPLNVLNYIKSTVRSYQKHYS